MPTIVSSFGDHIHFFILVLQVNFIKNLNSEYQENVGFSFGDTSPTSAHMK